jgi:ABC-2 type transport system permease protein
MWKMLLKIRDTLGTTIFLTTHYLDEADFLSDTICIMKKGKILAQGSCEDLAGYIKQNMMGITFFDKEEAEKCKNIVLVTFGVCSSCGFINFIMRSNGSFYRILIAPISRKAIVLGQMLEAVVVSLLEAAILCIISLFFSVKIGTGFVGILLIILFVFMAGFFMSGLSYSMSLLLPNEVIYETIMNAIVLPFFFLSTALFPLKGLDGSLRAIVLINPFTHLINALRSLIIGNTMLFSDLLPVILLFIIMCIGSFLLAMWRLKKETVS